MAQSVVPLYPKAQYIALERGEVHQHSLPDKVAGVIKHGKEHHIIDGVIYSSKTKQQ
jgi:hypothetical protein